jgi:hypothetical protein
MSFGGKLYVVLVLASFTLFAVTLAVQSWLDTKSRTKR